MYIYSNKYCTTGSIDGVKRGALLVLFTRDRKVSCVKSLHLVVKLSVIAVTATVASVISYLAPLHW